MLKRKQRHYPKIFACTFPSAENVPCETVSPCFAPMFHVEQFRHLFHAFVSHETKVPSLRMAPETVEKLSFFRQSVFWLRKTRTSESSHTETFSLLKYENRGTRPRFSCVCAANAFECALPRDCCFGVKTDFIDRLKCHPFGWHLYNIVSWLLWFTLLRAECR